MLAGTSAETFSDFIRELLERLPPQPPKIFLWDNLASHFSPETARLINEAGHSIIPRPPYSPQDAPIEYVFNTLEVELRKKMYQIHSNEELEQCVYDSIAGIGDTHAYFGHCGYGM